MQGTVLSCSCRLPRPRTYHSGVVALRRQDPKLAHLGYSLARVGRNARRNLHRMQDCRYAQPALVGQAASGAASIERSCSTRGILHGAALRRNALWVLRHITSGWTETSIAVASPEAFDFYCHPPQPLTAKDRPPIPGKLRALTTQGGATTRAAPKASTHHPINTPQHTPRPHQTPSSSPTAAHAPAPWWP